MPIVSSLNPVSIYGPGTTQTITISAGFTGESISSITVTKVPVSSGGAGTSYAYQSLSLNSNDFISVDSLSFSYGAGTTIINFQLSATYTDYLFDDQVIKYYNNPNNVKIGSGLTASKPSITYNKKVSNDAANPKVNSYWDKSESSSTVTAPDNLCNYYGKSSSWGQLNSTVGTGYTVDAIYSYTPSTKTSVNYYYTFSISYSNTDPFYGSGVSNITITQQVNYDINEAKNQFTKALNNQKNKPKFKCNN